MMTGCIYGETEQEVEQKVQQRSNGEKTAAEYRSSGLVVGTPDQVVEQLEAMAEAGLQRVMLQWLDWEDLAGLQSLANHVLPQVQ
jgi:alkanesulfonate monooxygenase SsuD/methylene tetrahydromethanopterin reductase-like flavin-dependent oxidoreductase (luciferase family)